MVDDRPPARKPSARSSARARRSAARLTAVQILYQAALTGQPLPQALTEFIDYRIGQVVEGIEIISADMETLSPIIAGVQEHAAEIDRVMAGALRGTTPERLELLLRVVMRAGIAELMLRRDLATGIIISDYLSVVDAFYSGPAIKLINAALDSAARKIRGNDQEPASEL